MRFLLQLFIPHSSHVLTKDGQILDQRHTQRHTQRRNTTQRQGRGEGGGWEGSVWEDGGPLESYHKSPHQEEAPVSFGEAKTACFSALMSQSYTARDARKKTQGGHS